MVQKTCRLEPGGGRKGGGAERMRVACTALQLRLPGA